MRDNLPKYVILNHENIKEVKYLYLGGRVGLALIV